MKPFESARWGKHWGLRRLAAADGFFSMVAIDQRPPIQQLIAKRRGVSTAAVSFEDMVLAKALLAEGLASHASALLVDPDFGLPAATPHLDPARGLLITLEEHRYDESSAGRRSRRIPNWSVEQIRRLGADAVKLLAWYRPDAAPEVLEHQQALVREVGAECRAADVAFIFELLVYPFAHEAGVGASYEEDPAKRSSLVIDSVRHFAAPEYGVDLFKVESPLPASTLPDPDSAAAAEVQPSFDQLGVACGGVPWVLLSAGASPKAFERALVLACRAGASGFLAGRSLWWEALHAFPDAEHVRARLRHAAEHQLRHLRHVVQRHGKPLRAVVDFTEVRAEGDVCRARQGHG